MSSPIKLLAFAGSARTDSYNKKLVLIATAGAREAGAEVTVIDLKDFPMPLFNEDLESADGLPENAKKIKQLMQDHHGFLIAAPEYNGCITPLLKNTIDWASRAESKDEPPLSCYRGKTAALVSASPGGFGGMRGLVVVRALLGNIGVTLVPDQVCISAAYQAFDEQGNLVDAKKQEAVKAMGRALAEMTGKLL
jgi:NAD(P)H-dependent FMN reductase